MSAASIEASGGQVAVLRTDVARRGDVAALVDLACRHFGRLDVLVNNAGVGPISPLDDLRVDEWDEMIDVNIKGVLYGIAAALPVFRRQGFGHVVNIASTAGHKTVAGQSVYSATKFAVRAISEGLRQEAGDKLRVTIISPASSTPISCKPCRIPAGEPSSSRPATRWRCLRTPSPEPSPLQSSSRTTSTWARSSSVQRPRAECRQLARTVQGANSSLQRCSIMPVSTGNGVRVRITALRPAAALPRTALQAWRQAAARADAA